MNVTDASFAVPPLVDYIATSIWATSGAVVGIQKRFDIVGVYVVALLSSMGGGLIRDGLLLHRVPVMLSDPVYLPLIAGVTALMALVAVIVPDVFAANGIRKLIELIDAVGIPLYAAIGMQLALHAAIPIPGIICIGMVTGVIGGLLRDIVVGDIPALLRPGQYSALSLLLACILFLVLQGYLDTTPRTAAWSMITLFFVLRVATIRFNWQTQAVWRERIERRRK